jgi:hypothetical protein
MRAAIRSLLLLVALLLGCNKPPPPPPDSSEDLATADNDLASGEDLTGGGDLAGTQDLRTDPDLRSQDMRMGGGDMAGGDMRMGGDMGGLACTGPDDCGGMTCCAVLDVGPGMLPMCPINGFSASCKPTCPGMFMLMCNMKSQTRLCRMKAHCAGDPTFTDCCEFDTAMGPVRACVPGIVAPFAKMCY